MTTIQFSAASATRALASYPLPPAVTVVSACELSAHRQTLPKFAAGDCTTIFVVGGDSPLTVYKKRLPGLQTLNRDQGVPIWEGERNTNAL